MEMKSNYSDRELMECIVSGNNLDAAIRFLYNVHYKKIQINIIQNSGTQEDAQDIFQEVIVTFIELVQQKKFRGDSTISTFLFALNRNIWLNELKKRERSQLREEKFEKLKSNVDEDISKHIIHRELRMQVMELVSKLGETCKKILLAFYYEDLSMREILLQLDYENEQVVRNKKYKCLKQLELMLTQKPGIADNLKSILLYE